MVPSPHIVATYVVIHTHTYCTFHHVDTEIHILIPCPASSRISNCMTWCLFISVAFCFVFIFLWCTYEHLSSVSIGTQLLGCLRFELLFVCLFVFALCWVRGGLSGVFCCGGCFLSLFLLIISLVSSSSVVHPPSKDRAAPPVFASSCAAWTFGGWKIPSSPLHQVCVFCFYAIWLLKETPPPPTSSFSIQRREMNGNKIFSCHHPFFWPCAGKPHSVSRKLCVKEWLPVSPPPRA